MAHAYLSKRWPPFVYRGKTYDFSHLDEFQFAIEDSAKIQRSLTVTFSDHCFTRAPERGDDPALSYSASDRRPGYFCLDRFTLSFGMSQHISYAVAGKVWTVQGDSFAVLPPTEHSSGRYYGIFFSLNRVTGLPVDLHMRVKSAYPIDDILITYGSVRFKHLAWLRMQGKFPGRIVDKHRRKP